MHTRWVGFCGTDREILSGELGSLAPGARQLVIGHEMAGVVAEVGRDVDDLEPGEIVVPMVRRGCGQCVPCSLDRADYCLSGQYMEYGITGLDGFARPGVVLPRGMLVSVPERLGTLAVLAEPLSVVIKALDEASVIRSRIPGSRSSGDRRSEGLSAVVAGAGSIGILATYLLTQSGFQVTTIDARDPASRAARLVRAAGATYFHARRDQPAAAASGVGVADVVIEATGDALLAFELLQVLAPGGVLVWLGTSGHGRLAQVDVGRAFQQAIANHHALVATVNSSREHFARAVAALDLLARRPHFAEIITAVLPPEQFEAAIQYDENAVKQVVAFDEMRER